MIEFDVSGKHSMNTIHSIRQRMFTPSRNLLPVAALVCLSAGLSVLLSENVMVGLTVAFFACFAIALFAYPELGLFLLLAVRPAMDILGDRTVVLFDRIPVNIAAATGVFAIGWCALVLVQRKAALSRMPLLWPLLALLGIGAASVLWTRAPDNTAYELIRLTSVVGMYCAASALITTQKQFWRFAKGFVLSLVIPVLFGLYQIATRTGFSFFDLSNRVYGTFGHPNVFGFYLVLSLCFLGALYVVQERSKRTKLAVLGFGMLLFLLALTYTRGAWLGMVIVAIVIGLARKPQLVVASMLLAGTVYLVAPFVNRLTFTTFGVDFARVPVISRLTQPNDEANSIDWRFGLWHEMAAEFRKRPVLGYGLGSFPVVRELQINDYYASTEAHNDYLRLAIETGIIGVGIYLLLLVLTVRALIRAYCALAGSERQLMVIGMLGFLAGFVVMSFFDNLLQGTPVMWAMWASLAAVLNLPMWVDREMLKQTQIPHPSTILGIRDDVVQHDAENKTTA